MNLREELFGQLQRDEVRHLAFSKPVHLTHVHGIREFAVVHRAVPPAEGKFDTRRIIRKESDAHLVSGGQSEVSDLARMHRVVDAFDVHGVAGQILHRRVEFNAIRLVIRKSRVWSDQVAQELAIAILRDLKRKEQNS